MDEMAEKRAIDPVEFRILNDTQVDPENPSRPFSKRSGPAPGDRRSSSQFEPTESVARQDAQERWLVGMGMVAVFHDNLDMKSAARVGIDSQGVVTVETDTLDWQLYDHRADRGRDDGRTVRKGRGAFR
jgi:xanthine dehydrogenase YagR molybdenum-binding subunit